MKLMDAYISVGPFEGIIKLLDSQRLQFLLKLAV